MCGFHAARRALKDIFGRALTARSILFVVWIRGAGQTYGFRKNRVFYRKKPGFSRMQGCLILRHK